MYMCVIAMGDAHTGVHVSSGRRAKRKMHPRGLRTMEGYDTVTDEGARALYKGHSALNASLASMAALLWDAETYIAYKNKAFVKSMRKAVDMLMMAINEMGGGGMLHFNEIPRVYTVVGILESLAGRMRGEISLRMGGHLTKSQAIFMGAVIAWTAQCIEVLHYMMSTCADGTIANRGERYALHAIARTMVSAYTVAARALTARLLNGGSALVEPQ